ncbi:histidine kinase [Tenacibaculum sp. 1B UA]|uniref:sensor histidine kinase n=1 Tax=Tenacibaculum sp. 1B UA TaxID=2922252 RepID=UPI002A24AD28|nr:histidine kinase [Tenacibaculum sp. 1B UA]MDX8552773.1 histidine kinase [Tenacibaculum sp. 1B UA]
MKSFASLKNNKTIPRKYHVIFWVSYFCFNVIRWGSYFGDYWYSLKSNLIEFPLHIILVYTSIYFLVPSFLAKKKYKTYIFLLIASLGFLYIIRTGLNYLLVTKNIWPESDGHQQAFTFNHIIAVTLGELYVLALATAIKFTIDWVYQKKRIATLQKEQLKSELNFLKTQIQPHFFFNTLNNLYALTLEQSEQAPEVVLKLSNIMQYVIYDVTKPKVKLLNEIQHIQNYIDLERLRCHENAIINIEIGGEIDNVKIPPLIFLSFIENSFKHGNKNSPNFYIYISIEKQPENRLLFSIKNSYEKDSLFKNSEKSGIGNINTKRRLNLLYKNNYDLSFSKNENKYCVTLNIPL